MDYNKDTLKRDLKRIGIGEGETVLVHSSLKNIGYVKGGPDTVVDALLETVGTTGTIAMPAFSYCFLKEGTQPFSLSETPSRVGLITETFRKKEETLRSNHPTHSIAARGKHARLITENHKGLSPYNRKGPFGKLYQLNSKILFIGCGLAPNSTLHAIEDWAGLPYLTPEKAIIKDKIGREKIVEVERTPSGHRDFYSGNNSKIVKIFNEYNLIKEGKIGKANVCLIEMKKLVDICLKLVKNKRDIFLCDSIKCDFCRRARYKINCWKKGEPTTFRAGTAKVNITPPPGLFLSGYGAKIISRGIHDKLYAKTVVMDDGDTKIALVSTDLIGLESVSVSKIRRLAKKLTGIKEGNIMICSTHTHSGPNVRSTFSRETLDRDWQKAIYKLIAGAIYEAWLNMKESKIGYINGKIPLNINRRVKGKDGRVIMLSDAPKGTKPNGPVDKEIMVLTIKDQKDRLSALIINYTAHGVCIGHGKVVKKDERLYSADYPGYTAKIFESLPEKPILLFTNGAIGDIFLKLYNGTFADAEKIGFALGNGIKKLLPKIKYHNQVCISSRRSYVKPTLRDDISPSVNLKMIDKRLEIQVLGINDIRLIGIPGELFVELGLEIKKKSLYQKTLIIGCANGSNLYFPTRNAYKEGGYETRVCYYKTGVGELIRDTVVQMIRN